MAEYLERLIDEERFERMLRRERVIRDRTDPFLAYDELDFIARFRLTKEGVRNLYHSIEQYFPESNRVHSIPPMMQILVTLRFYATGGYLKLVGDAFGISVTAVSNIIKAVSRTICLLKGRYISFPNAENRRQIQVYFFDMCRIPGVIGAIDCTHIPIVNPGGENGETFRNRKGYFSINVQATCDHDLFLTSITVRWPGSTHDSRIFDNSALCARLESGEIEGVLLGDNGYALRQFLLTPVLNPGTRAEQSFNRNLSRGRVKIENTFGVLKRRFPCLALDLRLKLQTSLLVITACAVLHNIARRQAMPLPPEVMVGGFVHPPADALPIERENGGRALRNIIIRTFE